MPSLLRVRSLSHSYLQNGLAYPVFTNVGFEVEAGTILGFFGPNGCGKSTLIRTIGEHCRRSSGNVELVDDAGQQLSVTLGVVPQQYDSSFFPWASLLDNIRITLPEPFANWSRNAGLIQNIATALDVTTDLKRKPRECSGGMKQAAAIVRAFAHDAQVLLADEPFSALDVNVSRRLRRSFRRFIKDKGVICILVLHELEEIVEMCDHVLVIPGRPFYTGSGEGVKARMLDNRQRERLETHTVDSQSFLDIAERLLAV